MTKMNPKLKLFVWKDVLMDWSKGVAFALAENLEEAKKLLRKELPFSVDDFEREFTKEPEVYESPMAFALWGGG